MQTFIRVCLLEPSPTDSTARTRLGRCVRHWTPPSPAPVRSPSTGAAMGNAGATATRAPGPLCGSRALEVASGPTRTQNPYGRADRASASATKSTYPAPDTCIGPRTAGGRHATPARELEPQGSPATLTQACQPPYTQTAGGLRALTSRGRTDRLPVGGGVFSDGSAKRE